MPVPAPKPWRRPPPDPLPVDLDDEAAAIDLIERMRSLRLNGAENFESWMQQRADADYAAGVLSANGGLTDTTRAQLDVEASLLRRQAHPPAAGARGRSHSTGAITSAREVDDPQAAEARAYDLIDAMRSLRLNGPSAGKDLHRERSYLLSQASVLLTAAPMRPATRSSLQQETDLLEQLSTELPEVDLRPPATPVIIDRATPVAPDTPPAPAAAPAATPEPPVPERLTRWRRLVARFRRSDDVKHT